MEEFHERVLMYAQTLYERALMRADKEEFKKAEFAASIALGATALLVEDEDTPEHIRAKAIRIKETLRHLLSEIWKAQTEGYGNRFLSGKKSKEEKLMDECMADLDWAIKEVKRRSKG